ncbi:MAG: hypothetical protein ACI865_002931 [Flavobacteriaceae bacterium]|jgi:hypothetical protein
MKFAKSLFFLPALLLLVAYFLRLGTLPNQILLVGCSFLIILVIMAIFLIRHFKKANGIGRKIIHLVCFIFVLPVLLLPLAGVFEQGIIPLVIYLMLSLILSIYFIKMTDRAPSFAAPNNYRNFVLLNLLLIIFNSPVQNVLPDVFYSPDFKAEHTQNGPKIYIDEGHNNLHTKDGLYTTFTNLLEKDGYDVCSFDKQFTAKTLKNIDLLVISNALNEKNVNDWNGPVYSAFSKSEIKALKEWVNQGGALFFIADHMPFGAASKDLASTFGFTFSEGSVIKTVNDGVDLFSRKRKTLVSNIITDGRNASEFVDSIVTFTGQAIEIPKEAHPILLFNEEFAHYSPETRKNIKDVEAEAIVGLSQGAYMEFGTGRIVVFGEAAMFTGQLPAGLSFWKKIGMNSPKAKNNFKLLLNIVHWLDHKLEE